MSPTKAEGVLLLSAMYGEGHRRAAQAVGLALDELKPALMHWEEDYFDFVDHRLNRLVARTYVLSVRHMPVIWDAFYRGTSHIAPNSSMQRFLNGLGRRRLLRHLQERRPRVVLNTFPTPAGVLSTLRGYGELSLPNLVVVTDYTVHSQWLHPHVDRYYVGSDSVREGMIRRGVPGEKILATGIPTHPRFRELPARQEMRAALGLDERPTVLAMAGAYGMIGGFPDIVKALMEEDLPCQILVVAGRDPQLRAALEALPQGKRTTLRVFGFVEDIERLYAASDFVFGKSGGLTVTETLQCGLPMLIFRPIPGQEQVNAAFVSDADAGVWVRDPEDLGRTFRMFATDPQLRERLSQGARRLARPDAAAAIAKDVAYWHDR
ncbi:MAG: glycosyltransferase [Thermaerobacter sp.]|nr:glycosyltransferase [Thermaerobacter sp.]